MGILNYSTSVSSQKSATEISGKLAAHGASKVSLLYTDGEPTGVAFSIETPFGPRDFQLPANADGVFDVISKQYRARKIERRYVNRPQAQRVAWRILKDWIEAQLAIIEAGMVLLDEVMLPYMITDFGTTVTTQYRASQELRNSIRSIES